MASEIPKWIYKNN